MKKSFLALFMAMGLVAGVNAQDQATTEEEAAVANASESINHWSLAVKGGIDYLRAADQKVGFEIGGLVERTFNPRWGMGLEYMYLNNDVDACKGNPEMDGYNHDIDIFGSINLSNIIAPYRKAGWQKLNWFVNGGMGVTIYGSQFGDADKETGCKLLFVGSSDLEYNVCKYLAIFLDAQYRMNTNSESTQKRYGRSIFGANLGLRVMFGGESNIRNIAWADYIPQVEVPDMTPLFDAQKKELDAKAAAMQKEIDDQNNQIKNLESKIKFTQDSLDRHIYQTKPKVAYTPTAEEAQIIKTALSNLEFESAKATIKSSSYTYLDGLAELLKKHPEWSVKLAGHTDNTGKAAKNLQLSKDRANAVKNYLVSKGADSANIEAEGYGQTKPIASNNTAAGKAKNRRVEVELFSK
ncbi:MAG: OmpA family protein [Paludibacteraceae bacterium]|nr:OmpA family protein [Paludibacteraceae bacterium]